MDKLRLAVVISHPIQHFAPLFRELARVSGLEVRVFYCCDWGVRDYVDVGFNQVVTWDVPLLEGYDHQFLPIRRRPTELTYWQVDNPAIEDRLDDYQPHAIWVHGYSHRTCHRAVHWARGKSMARSAIRASGSG